mmetsp:Transcript_15727/g.23116  ORF Transcript_15727/g.23116 Transcript_15727/m.23116 type:complete len:159 (+) Transcript_15727:454-930(+)
MDAVVVVQVLTEDEHAREHECEEEADEHNEEVEEVGSSDCESSRDDREARLAQKRLEEAEHQHEEVQDSEGAVDGHIISNAIQLPHNTVAFGVVCGVVTAVHILGSHLLRVEIYPEPEAAQEERENDLRPVYVVPAVLPVIAVSLGRCAGVSLFFQML